MRHTMRDPAPNHFNHALAISVSNAQNRENTNKAKISPQSSLKFSYPIRIYYRQCQCALPYIFNQPRAEGACKCIFAYNIER